MKLNDIIKYIENELVDEYISDGWSIDKIPTIKGKKCYNNGKTSPTIPIRYSRKELITIRSFKPS